MAAKQKTFTGAEALALRKRFDMTQSEFWAPLGITQSAGSRYESGRAIPKPVQILLAIAYGTPKQCDQATNAIRACA